MARKTREDPSGQRTARRPPEFIAEVMKEWAEKQEITLVFIQKGKPYQNGLVERFNRTYREEVLDRFLFDNLKHIQAVTNA
jgi:putative transposase